MTVGKLKLELQKYPDYMSVFVAERKTAFAYGLINSVREQEITFSESYDLIPDDETTAKENVVVIDEE